MLSALPARTLPVSQFLSIAMYKGFKNDIITGSGGVITTASFAVMQKAAASNDKFSMWVDRDVGGMGMDTAATISSRCGWAG